MAEDLFEKWWADLYDREETQTDDIEFMMSVLDGKKRNILEVCCGTGRILVPLAKAGHMVTGFDKNDYMLAKIADKAEGIRNITWYNADALLEDWGCNHDVIILAGNIMINIEADMNYEATQKLFISKAYDSVKPGGYLYIDFNLFMHPEEFFGKTAGNVIFEGIDSSGNYGKSSFVSETYDVKTQICTSVVKNVLKTRDGQVLSRIKTKIKHIPSRKDIESWLAEAGFAIREIYGDYQRNEISETTCRAVILAERER